MLSCEKCLEYFSLSLDGELPPTERRAMQEHVDACPECRATCQQLLQMEYTLQEMEETPAPPELIPRVMEKIQTEKARPPISLRRRVLWRGVAGLAACAVLCVGLYYGGHLNGGQEVLSGTAAVRENPGETSPQVRVFSSGQVDEREIIDALPEQEGGAPKSAQYTGPGEQEQTYDSGADAGEPSAQTEDTDTPRVNAVLAAPPWGNGSVLTLQTLPEELAELLPDVESWNRDGGTLWCAVTAEKLADLVEALAQIDGGAELPKTPYVEPCAVILLPGESS